MGSSGETPRAQDHRRQPGSSGEAPGAQGRRRQPGSSGETPRAQGRRRQPGGSGGSSPRADTVGSLLRNEAVVRAARRAGPADTAILDDAAIDAIKLQEDIGLDVITDGEVRRTAWAQTPRFLDAFAATTGRAALNWRGA